MKRSMPMTAMMLLTSISLVSVTGSAFAETKWEKNHPRRDQVNDRLERQDVRINQEYKEGDLTKVQTHQLHQEDRGIRQEERSMAKLDGGHITKADQAALNQQENAVSGQIGK